MAVVLASADSAAGLRNGLHWILLIVPDAACALVLSDVVEVASLSVPSAVVGIAALEYLDCALSPRAQNVACYACVRATGLVLLLLCALTHVLRLHQLGRVAMVGARRLCVLERATACNRAKVLNL